MKIRDGLREADAVFQSTPIPPRVMSSLRRRVLRERRSWAWWLFAPVAVMLAAFLLWPEVPEVEDIQLAAGGSYVPPTPRGVAVFATQGATLHRERDRLRVRAGSVTFSVEKRRSGESPVRVDVSHGTIEVVGTRFTIHQRADSGDVTLHEGVIRFAERTLHAGETLDWPPTPAVVVAPPEPLAPLPAPSAAAPGPKKQAGVHQEPAVIHETDSAWLLQEVDLMRSRSEYGEAVRLLEKGLGGIVSAATRERFSYELGSILTHQLDDSRRACAHWVKHRATFPEGRYAREVKAARERLQCAP